MLFSKQIEGMEKEKQVLLHSTRVGGNKTICEVVNEARNQGLAITFSPQTALARIYSDPPDEKWLSYLASTTIRAVGVYDSKYNKGKDGILAQVISHKPTELTSSFTKPNHCNLATISKEQFNALIEQDGEQDSLGRRLVWVLDYVPLGQTYVRTDEATNDDSIKAFFGGENIARNYMQKYKIAMQYQINFFLSQGDVGKQWVDAYYHDPNVIEVIDSPSVIDINRPTITVPFFGGISGGMNGIGYLFDSQQKVAFLGLPSGKS